MKAFVLEFRLIWCQAGNQNGRWSGRVSWDAQRQWIDWVPWSPGKTAAFRNVYEKQPWPLYSETTAVGGWMGKLFNIRDMRPSAVCPVFLLTVSHTSGSPWFHGRCLTFKHHKGLVFLISIAFGNSDFYQHVFRLPFMGPLSTIFRTTGSWLYGAIIMGRLVWFGQT